MPVAQYVIPTKNVRITKKFPTPKKMPDLKAWLSAARKVIPEIPDIRLNNCPYYIIQETINEDTIYVVFESSYEDKIHLVIDRKAHQGL